MSDVRPEGSGEPSTSTPRAMPEVEWKQPLASAARGSVRDRAMRPWWYVLLGLSGLLVAGLVALAAASAAAYATLPDDGTRVLLAVVVGVFVVLAIVDGVAGVRWWRDPSGIEDLQPIRYTDAFGFGHEDKTGGRAVLCVQPLVVAAFAASLWICLAMLGGDHAAIALAVSGVLLVPSILLFLSVLLFARPRFLLPYADRVGPTEPSESA